MTYDEIIKAAVAYSDRTDAVTASNFDSFLRVVEARINRQLKTSKMSIRSTLQTVKDQEYYGLPDDFAGLRDIQINNQDKITLTMQLLTPEAMNHKSFEVSQQVPIEAQGIVYYSIIADQLQIFPTQEDNEIEIVYYQKLPELTSNSPTNWLSEDNPDTYVFGLVTEISAYAKDAEAKMLWDERFNESLGQIYNNDIKDRWSGPAMQVRV